jgi:hypothetical protein
MKKYDDDESYEDTGIGMAEEQQRELMEEENDYGDKPMDDTELQGIVASEVEDAITYIDSDLSPLRAEATAYYRGDLFGNEEEGNSQYVSTDVRDTVNSMLPSIMKTVFSSEKVVEFVPRGPEDVATAEQMTDYVNYVVQQDNDGFGVMYSTFKDSLVRKCGIVKTWWEEKTKIRVETYTGLDETTMMVIMSEQGAIVTVVEQYDDPDADPNMLAPDPMTGEMIPGPAPQLFDVTVKREIKEGQVKLESIPLEEFLIDRNALSLDTAAIIGHRKMATVTELVELGYDEDEVTQYVTSSDLENNSEYLTRRPTTTTIGMSQESNNPAMQRALYIELWMNIDYDGDGLAELRKICCMGEGYTIVNNEPADFIPFADFPCDPEPHTSPLEANSIFDYTRDLQEVNSDIMRNTLDSLAQSIHPRTAVVEGQVNMDDVLNNETGGIIRMRAPGMVQPFTTPFVGQAAFPMLDYLSNIRESRTGMSKASMGLDADALQSTTKAAVTATVSASQMRLELTTRILAQGMQKLFKNVLRLVTVHQDKPRMVRLRNQWTPVDPRAWDAEMDVSINVALGTGDVDQKMSMLAMIAGKQEQALQQMGPMNPLVTPAQYANTLRKIAELAGFKDSSQFFNAIPADYQPPEKQEKPTPEEVLAQVQAQSIQADIQKKAAELELKREEMIRNDDRERDQMASDRFVKLRELELKYGAQINEAQLNVELERDREAVRAIMQGAQQQQQQGPMNG